MAGLHDGVTSKETVNVNPHTSGPCWFVRPGVVGAVLGVVLGVVLACLEHSMGSTKVALLGCPVSLCLTSTRTPYKPLWWHLELAISVFPQLLFQLWAGGKGPE